MKLQKLIILLLLISFCGGNEIAEIPEVTSSTKIEATSTTINSENQNSTTISTEIKKLDCPLEGEKKFVIDITNNSEKKTNLGLYFYINSLYDPLETTPIKTQCVEENEKTNFKFNFDLNNKPELGRFGDGTQDWYDICFQPIKNVFQSDEKIYFEFTDNEILIKSKLIYDRIIDRNTGYVTFISEDVSKPNIYCDNIDLETSLPSTTTTTTLPENVLIEFDNCPDTVRDNENFVLKFTVFAGNNEISDITYSQKYLSVNESGSFKNLDLNIPIRNGYENYTLSYSYGKTQQNNWTREFKLFVKTKSGSTTEGACITTVIVTNPASTTTTTTIQNSSSATSTPNSTTTSTTTTTTSTTTTTTSTTTTTVPPITYPSTPSSSTWSTFTGSGDSVVDISSVGTDVLIAQVSHSGSGNFAIVVRDSSLDYQGLKVNTIGNYSGIISINFENEVNSNLEISADGNWEIIIKPIASSANFDGNSISGNGDTVIEAYELKSVDSLTISHSGSSNFSIVQYRCNGSYNGLLVNTIGSYSGSNITDSGTCFLEIIADGSWSISK